MAIHYPEFQMLYMNTVFSLAGYSKLFYVGNGLWLTGSFYFPLVEFILLILLFSLSFLAPWNSMLSFACPRIQCILLHRSSRPEVFCKKSVLKNFAKFTGKHLCQRLFLIKLQALAYNPIKTESLLQAFFSCEFCEIFQNNFLIEHLQKDCL